MRHTTGEDVRALGRNNEDITLPALRHTFFTRLIWSGIALHLVSQWGNKASIEITMERYAKIVAEVLRRGAAILDAMTAQVGAPKAVSA